MSTHTWYNSRCATGQCLQRETAVFLVLILAAAMQGPMTALHEPYLNDVTVFDVNTHTWHTPDVQGARPPVRDSHAAVAVGDRMVIYGGDCGKEYLSDVWAYHVEHQRWQAFKVLL